MLIEVREPNVLVKTSLIPTNSKIVLAAVPPATIPVPLEAGFKKT